MMNDVLNKIFIFTAGVAIGSVVTFKIVKTKYEEIEYVEDDFEIDDESDFNSDDEDDEYTPTEEDIARLKETITTNGYRNYSIKNDKKEEEVEDVDKPYVISPEEFDENEDYKVVSLLYFNDKVLTDERYNVIDDVEDTVGEDSLNHFGEFEDDSVFVRDDARKIDYEILLDTRNFSEVYK